MKSSKSIERLFQEGLKDLQASPSPKVWNGIEAKLTGKKHFKRILPLWWQVASVAAILLIFSSIGAYYYNSSVYNSSIRLNKPSNFNSSSLELVPARYRFSSVDESLSHIENSFESHLAFEITEPVNSALANSVINRDQTEPKADLAAKPNISGSSLSTVSQLNGFSINSPSPVSMASTLISTDEKENTTDQKKSLFDAIEENGLLAEEENKSIQRLWAIQPNVAPVFMNSFSGGNPIESTLLGKTTSNPNLSYGVNVAYAINKKIKIRTGINQVAMGYNTQDVILSISSPSFKGERLTNNNIQTHLLGNVSLVSATNFRNMQSRTFANSLVPSKLNSIGSINHELGFLEVPLEVQYALIDKKLGVHLLGGASTYVLNNNEIFFENEGSSFSIGQADNLNTFSFSANLGVGLDYSFSEQVSLNLEPKFMYQINTFETATTNFQPYFFGIYSGVKFKF